MKFRLIWLHTLLIVMLAITNALAQDTASVTGARTQPTNQDELGRRVFGAFVALGNL